MKRKDSEIQNSKQYFEEDMKEKDRQIRELRALLQREKQEEEEMEADQKVEHEIELAVERSKVYNVKREKEDEIKHLCDEIEVWKLEVWIVL